MPRLGHRLHVGDARGSHFTCVRRLRGNMQGPEGKADYQGDDRQGQRRFASPGDSAANRPAVKGRTKITGNCINVHRVDAWYERGLNDQSAPITVYTVMKAANCSANITR